MLVVLEGIDGAGKGTQSKALLRWALDSGISAQLFSFPAYGQNPSARYITNLLNGHYGPANAIHPELKMLAFALDRAVSKEALFDALENKALVIIDRYVASNAAYQGFGLKNNAFEAFANEVAALEFDALALPRPDLTLLLKSDPKKTRAYVMKKGSRDHVEGALDENEKNQALQEAALANLVKLSQNKVYGPWYICNVCENDGTFRPPHKITTELISALKNPTPSLELSCHGLERITDDYQGEDRIP